MKNTLTFNIEKTLTEGKSSVSDEIAKILVECIDNDFELCLISDKKLDSFFKSIVGPILKNGATPNHLDHLHLLPDSGVQCYHYEDGKTWKKGPFSVTFESKKGPYSEKHWTSAYDLSDGNKKKVERETVFDQLMEELGVGLDDILHFDVEPKNNGKERSASEMGIETTTVGSCKDTAFALRGILGVI